MKDVVHLKEEFESLEDYWSPRVIGQVNDQYVKVAKIKGDLAWHKHDHEDELFVVVRGSMVMEYKDRDPVPLQAGDMHVVPRGVLHNPVAGEECWVTLVETTTTRHTGDVVHPRTRTIEQQLADAESGDD